MFTKQVKRNNQKQDFGTRNLKKFIGSYCSPRMNQE